MDLLIKKIVQFQVLKFDVLGSFEQKLFIKIFFSFSVQGEAYSINKEASFSFTWHQCIISTSNNMVSRVISKFC